MNEASIAAYLLENPDFFERHADTLTAAKLSSGLGQKAVSLQERQAQMLREKIKGLELRIIDMVRNSSENYAIAFKMHQWSCALAQVQDPRQIPHAVAEGLQREFDVPQVGIRIWDVAGPYDNALFTMGVSDDAKAFATSLTMPFCGPNLGFEPTEWLPRPSEVQSLALLSLREGNHDTQSKAFGLLVLGSPDPLRFDATMGTEFLSRIAEQASAALGRLRVMPSGN